MKDRIEVDVITQLTWGKPDKRTYKLLRRLMLIRLSGLLLCSLLLCLAVCLIWILDFIVNASVFYLHFCLILVIYGYYIYRAGFSFGSTLPSDADRLLTVSSYRTIFVIINIIPTFAYLIVLHDSVVMRLILPAAMAVLTYWKEYFIILLFVAGKYDLKKGKILSVYVNCKRPRGYRQYYFYLIYSILFEDEAGRTIPVLGDYAAYRKYKNQTNADAILIRFKIGKKYLFFVV